MGFFAFFNVLTLRNCLSMAIIKMVLPHNHTSEVIAESCTSEDTISNNTINSESHSSYTETFEWDEKIQVTK